MKRSVTYLLILLFISLSSAESHGILIETAADGGFNISGTTYSGEIISIIDATKEPTIKYEEDLVALLFSCGAPCYYTIFFDRKSGNVSEEFEATFFSADFKRRLVAVPTHDTVTIHAIFQPEKKLSIPVKMPSFMSSYYDVETVFNDDTLWIKHPVNDDMDIVTDTISFTFE